MFFLASKCLMTLLMHILYTQSHSSHRTFKGCKLLENYLHLSLTSEREEGLMENLKCVYWMKTESCCIYQNVDTEFERFPPAQGGWFQTPLNSPASSVLVFHAVWIILSTFWSWPQLRLQFYQSLCSYLSFQAYCQSYHWMSSFESLEKITEGLEKVRYCIC